LYNIKQHLRIFLNIYYFFRSVYLRGFINTLRLIKYEPKAEKFYNINTSGIKTSKSSQNFHYQGANYLILEKIINTVKEILPNAIFFDIGCGKGRACIVAAKLGFTKVIGIDLDSELIDLAKQNAKQANVEVEFILANAIEYNYQNVNTVYFLFNPFNETVLNKVLKKINKVTTKKIIVVYMNPKYSKEFYNNGFKLLNQIKTKKYIEAEIFSLNLD